MKLISYLKKIRNNYVINQVNRIKLPDFNKSPVVRVKLRFYGKVQKVGFRFETYHLARKLGLTGWVKNKEDQSVEAEIQGEKEKIAFLIKFMKSLKRASVKVVKQTEIPMLKDEKEFIVIK